MKSYKISVIIIIITTVTTICFNIDKFTEQTTFSSIACHSAMALLSGVCKIAKLEEKKKRPLASPYLSVRLYVCQPVCPHGTTRL